MRKSYLHPECDMIALESTDVITWSGTTDPTEVDQADIQVSAPEEWFN